MTRKRHVCQKSRSRSDEGFSLIEALLSLSVLSMIMLSAVAYLGSFMRQIDTDLNLTQVKAFKEKLIAAIQSDEAWRNSMSYPENSGPAAMDCLKNPRTICRATTFNPNTNPPLSIYSASGLDDEPQYNQNGVLPGPPPVRAIFDATLVRGGLFNGITASGKRCFGFSPNFSTPQCPLRYNLRWYAVTANGSPMVKVYGFLQVSPNTLRGFNPNNYSIGHIDENGQLTNPIIRMAQ